LNHQTLYWVTYLAFMFSALFGLSVVMAVTELVQSANRNLIRWIGLLGIIGLSVIAVNFWYHPGTAVDKAKAVVGQQGSFEGYGLMLDTDQEGRIQIYPFADSPAAKAGVKAGDVLVSVNGQEIRKGEKRTTVKSVLQNSPDGRVEITVQSAGQPARRYALRKSRVDYWDVSAQSAILASTAPDIDPAFLIGFGLTGLWFLVIHGVAMKKRLLDRPLNVLGLLAGVGLWLFSAQFFVHSAALIAVGPWLGLVLGALWYLRVGLFLKK
ncbi:MAG TPA: PDZ domain-containing protein, partial [bacterium]